MCGIAGAIGYIDDGVIEAVGRAHGALRHRGPDAEGTWQDVLEGRGAALAHRRLAIIDLSADGAQPMHDKASGLSIVFNGGIAQFSGAPQRARVTRVSVSDPHRHGSVAQGPRGVGRPGSGAAPGHVRLRPVGYEQTAGLIGTGSAGIKRLYTQSVVERFCLRPRCGLCSLQAWSHASSTQPASTPISGTASWSGPQTIIRGLRLLPPGSTLALAETGER